MNIRKNRGLRAKLWISELTLAMKRRVPRSLLLGETARDSKTVVSNFDGLRETEEDHLIVLSGIE